MPILINFIYLKFCKVIDLKFQNDCADREKVAHNLAGCVATELLKRFNIKSCKDSMIGSTDECNKSDHYEFLS